MKNEEETKTVELDGMITSLSWSDYDIFSHAMRLIGMSWKELRDEIIRDQDFISTVVEGARSFLKIRKFNIEIEESLFDSSKCALIDFFICIHKNQDPKDAHNAKAFLEYFLKKRMNIECESDLNIHSDRADTVEEKMEIVKVLSFDNMSTPYYQILSLKKDSKALTENDAMEEIYTRIHEFVKEAAKDTEAEKIFNPSIAYTSNPTKYAIKKVEYGNLPATISFNKAENSLIIDLNKTALKSVTRSHKAPLINILNFLSCNFKEGDEIDFHNDTVKITNNERIHKCLKGVIEEMESQKESKITYQFNPEAIEYIRDNKLNGTTSIGHLEVIPNKEEKEAIKIEKPIGLTEMKEGKNL